MLRESKVVTKAPLSDTAHVYSSDFTVRGVFGETGRRKEAVKKAASTDKTPTGKATPLPVNYARTVYVRRILLGERRVSTNSCKYPCLSDTHCIDRILPGGACVYRQPSCMVVRCARTVSRI